MCQDISRAMCDGENAIAANYFNGFLASFLTIGWKNWPCSFFKCSTNPHCAYAENFKIIFGQADENVKI